METKQCCKNKIPTILETSADTHTNTCLEISVGTDTGSSDNVNKIVTVLETHTNSKLSACINKIMVFYPLILSFSYIIGGAIISEYPYNNFDWKHFSRIFMGLLLLLFSYVKLLNPRGFVNTFKKYDIVTYKCELYGYAYPLIEATLGVFYIINYKPIIINSIIIGLLSINLIQVIIALFQKKKLECACMGSLGFNLPLSYVTITEDIIMIIMAAVMLIF